MMKQNKPILRVFAAALSSLFLFAGSSPTFADTFKSSGPISAGDYHSLAVKEDGSLWAWGDNYSGRLGDGTVTVYKGNEIAEDNNKSSPVKIMDDVASVSAGFYHSLAVKTDNSLWAWGSGSLLGNGSTIDRSSPVIIMDGVVSAAAGTYRSFAVKEDGSLWAWGANNYGMLGDGTTNNRITPVKVMDDVSSVAVGLFHTLAVKKDGSLWAWGRNYGTAPVKVLDGVASAAAGAGHNLAVKEDGSLWAWGLNDRGQLGDGTAADKNSPVKIMDGVASVTAGSAHTIAIKEDGSLWAWGANNFGLLGEGTTTDRSFPVKIIDGAVSAAAGDSHTLAVKSDGSLWSWGQNSRGQLGDGTAAAKLTPVQIMDDAKLPEKISSPVHEIKVLLNGEELSFDQPPIIENDRTLVPLRAIFEALDAEVEWDQAAQTVIAVREDTTIMLTIGSHFMYKNDEEIILDVPAKVVNDRTLAPARVVAESFGAEVDWDQETKTVTIIF